MGRPARSDLGMLTSAPGPGWAAEGQFAVETSGANASLTCFDSGVEKLDLSIVAHGEEGFSADDGGFVIWHRDDSAYNNYATTGLTVQAGTDVVLMSWSASHASTVYRLKDEDAFNNCDFDDAVSLGDDYPITVSGVAGTTEYYADFEW